MTTPLSSNHGRIARDTAIAVLTLAALAVLWRPGEWRVPLGVLGGGALVGVSFWAIASGVDGLTRTGAGRGRRLVKVFTRYGILALAAYAMMVPFEFDPVGMLMGVTTLALALGVEAIRGVTAPRAGGRRS